ncbi:MAG: hypothetical protein UC390_02580 [Peptococcaceae bacterium]|nr:hypothetical protein [Peptococcaceae bacterium]MEE0546598.1 hypothetical protein [Peptococcaceae bacterium]
MKGHLELFEHRLKQVGEKLPGMEGKNIDDIFDAFVEALGSDEVPFYDVHSGSTLADYYNSQFIRFVKKHAGK